MSLCGLVLHTGTIVISTRDFMVINKGSGIYVLLSGPQKRLALKFHAFRHIHLTHF